MKYKVTYAEWKTESAYKKAYNEMDDEKWCKLYDDNVRRRAAEAAGDDPEEAAKSFFTGTINSGAALFMLNEYDGYIRTTEGRVFGKIDVWEGPRTAHVFGASMINRKES